jgi:hypothetical protein
VELYFHSPNTPSRRGVQLKKVQEQIYFYLLRDIWWEGLDGMHLAQDNDQWLALVNTVMNLRVPYKVRNFSTSLGTISFSRRTLMHGVNKIVHVIITYVQAGTKYVV